MSGKLGVAAGSVEFETVRVTLMEVESSMTDSDQASIFVDTLESIHRVLTNRGQGSHFRDLRGMIENVDPTIRNQFFHTTFPAMAQDIAVFIANNKEIEYLTSGIARAIEFPVSDVYILVAMCFMGIPLINASGESTLRDGTCMYMFSNRPKQVAKLTCLLNYFNVMVAARQGLFPPEVCNKILNRRIVLERLVLSKSHGAEWWMNECRQPLTGIEYMEKYKCIESAHDALQADFANKHIGGGVLRTGCVQEEIRFIISPECLISVFLCDPLADNEALIIRNTLQISAYSGYSQSFKCTGFSRSIKTLFSDSGQSSLPVDDIVCIDATPFTTSEERERQFSIHAIIRELEKCRCGLTYSGGKPFATGNWGCGVFGGDSQLKALIQWMAASACSRDLMYFPFDDMSTHQLPDLARVAQDIPVNEIFGILLESLSHGEQKHNLIGSIMDRIRQRNSIRIS